MVATLGDTTTPVINVLTAGLEQWEPEDEEQEDKLPAYCYGPRNIAEDWDEARDLNLLANALNVSPQWARHILNAAEEALERNIPLKRILCHYCSSELIDSNWGVQHTNENVRQCYYCGYLTENFRDKHSMAEAANPLGDFPVTLR